jgi:7,8-dihydropterin-6-yl-methyl-4-(beta-D-ribofuranosyl)aminobenzene 5'-phosphate synthase
MAADPLVAETGFSALIKVEKAERTHRLLFDCGIPTDGMVENMSRLDIGPGEIGAVVLSHGH